MALPMIAYKALKNRTKAGVTTPVATIALAAGLGLGIFFGIRLLVNKFKQNHQQQQALTEGNPAFYATQLKMAFENDNAFGWGTDEEGVYRALKSIPSASMMQKVQKAYKDLFGQNLSLDLKSELSTTEYSTALNIINSKS